MWALCRRWIRLKKTKIKPDNGHLQFYFSPLLFVMLVVLVACGYALEAVSYFVAIVMHEMCHAAYAAKLGYALNRLRLMPYGAGLTGEFEGARNGDEIKIALIGPCSNLVVGVCVVALWWLWPSTYVYTDIFAYANVFTAAINLVPVFPLDGGRALLAALSMRYERRRVYRVMRIVGILFAGFLITMSVIILKRINFSFLFMAFFIFVSTIIPDKRCKYERLYSMAFRRAKIEKGLPIREIMVSDKTPIYKLFRMLKSDAYTGFVIVDDNLTVLGRISESELERLSATCEHNISIRQAKNL